MTVMDEDDDASLEQVGQLPRESAMALVQPRRPVAGTLIVPRFDYNDIEDASLRRECQQAGQAIEVQNKVVAETLVERGRLLLGIRDRLKATKQWTGFVREVVGCSITTADNSIRVYQLVGNRLASVAQLDANVLYLLCTTSVDDATRQAVLDDLDAHRIRPTLADVRKKLGRVDVSGGGGGAKDPEDRLLSLLVKGIDGTMNWDSALNQDYMAGFISDHIDGFEDEIERSNARADYRVLADAIKKGAK